MSASKRSSTAKRYQARVSIDERHGDLWAWIDGLPERTRVGELIFLAQLGLLARRAVTIALPGGVAAQGNPAGQQSGPFGPAAPRVESQSRENSTDPITVLAGWGNVDIDFPDEFGKP